MHYGNNGNGGLENDVVNNVWKSAKWCFANVIYGDRVLFWIALDGFEGGSGRARELVTQAPPARFVPMKCIRYIDTRSITKEQ